MEAGRLKGANKRKYKHPEDTEHQAAYARAGAMDQEERHDDAALKSPWASRPPLYQVQKEKNMEQVREERLIASRSRPRHEALEKATSKEADGKRDEAVGGRK